MKFEDLSAEDQKLLSTDLGEFEKEAAAEVALAQEMYNTGFNKLAAETADYLDSLLVKEAEEKEEEEKEEEDEETKKTASDLGAFIERGFFDGLCKLGQERHGDAAFYLMPYVEEKVAEAGAQMALSGLKKKDSEKVAEDNEPSWWAKQKGMHRAMRSGDKGFSKLITNKELVKKRFAEGGKGALKGGAGGAALGAGVGGLAALLSKGRVKPQKGAGLGALAGGTVGVLGGDVKGAYKADKDYMKARGIELKNLGFSSKFSPEAKAKYIDAYEKKNDKK